MRSGGSSQRSFGFVNQTPHDLSYTRLSTPTTVGLYVRAGPRRASRVSISSWVKVKSKMSRLSRM
jgi:hypothetical protein